MGHEFLLLDSEVAIDRQSTEYFADESGLGFGGKLPESYH